MKASFMKKSGEEITVNDELQEITTTGQDNVKFTLRARGGGFTIIKRTPGNIKIEVIGDFINIS